MNRAGVAVGRVPSALKVLEGVGERSGLRRQLSDVPLKFPLGRLAAFVAHLVGVGDLLGVPSFVDGRRHFEDEPVNVRLLAGQFLGDTEGDGSRASRQRFSGFKFD